MASLKDKLAKAFPVFSKLLRPGRVQIVKVAMYTSVAGAGSKTVSGLMAGDELLWVHDLTALTDITATCSITADDTMATTTVLTASNKLQVGYLTWDDRR